MNKTLLTLLCAFFLMGPLYSSDYTDLDAIALRSGADKGSDYHNYTEVYARYFAPLRNKPIKFLEIGIYKGASAKLWEEYFPKADLHFVDISLTSTEYFSPRCHYHLCNQESPYELQQFMQNIGGDFDIIIDDGGHTMQQQIVSFTTLFPYIKSGGMYIIEDLHTSYWRRFGGGGYNTTVNFLKSLIDEVNFIGNRTTRASHISIPPSIQNELNIYREKIYSMHFYDSLVVIIKR